MVPGAPSSMYGERGPGLRELRTERERPMKTKDGDDVTPEDIGSRIDAFLADTDQLFVFDGGLRHLVSVKVTFASSPLSPEEARLRSRLGQLVEMETLLDENLLNRTALLEIVRDLKDIIKPTKEI
jgi:hypothetical protein